jgi:hypothetical protein
MAMSPVRAKLAAPVGWELVRGSGGDPLQRSGTDTSQAMWLCHFA